MSTKKHKENLVHWEEPSEAQKAKLGARVYEETRKLLAGEHLGGAVILPFMLDGSGLMCRLRIELPYWFDAWEEAGERKHRYTYPDGVVVAGVRPRGTKGNG